MTRTRSYLLTTTALASIVGAAVPAFAQAPAPAQMYAPAPMYAPPPAPAPMVAPAPMQEPMPVMPVAPVMAPRAADDMTGSVGLGVGVASGTNELIRPDTTNLMLKYWMSDSMAILPRLALNMSKTKNVDASWGLAPEVLASFVLLKGASTRLSAGAGLGFSVLKNPPADASIGFFIPVELSVEHFFTRWFAMGIAIHEHLIDFNKPNSDTWTLGMNLNTTTYMGSLFFYTD